MARSYEIKDYLKYTIGTTQYTTNTYIKATITETTYSTTSSTFSYTVQLGVDSGFYHYVGNNFITVSWGGTVIKGSSSSNYGVLYVGTCKGTSGTPACEPVNGDDHGTTGKKFDDIKTLYSGTITIDNKTINSYSKSFAITFKQTYGNPLGDGHYYTYTASASRYIPGTIIQGAFDYATTQRTLGWAFVPWMDNTKTVAYVLVKDSAGTVVKTYSDVCNEVSNNNGDVAASYPPADWGAVTNNCRWSIDWDLSKDVGRGIFTVTCYAKYDGGASFPLGDTKTVDTTGTVTVYNGSAWKSGDVYVYNGSSWVKAKKVYVYNGSSWVE